MRRATKQEVAALVREVYGVRHSAVSERACAGTAWRVRVVNDAKSPVEAGREVFATALHDTIGAAYGEVAAHLRAAPRRA